MKGFAQDVGETLIAFIHNILNKGWSLFKYGQDIKNVGGGSATKNAILSKLHRFLRTESPNTNCLF